MYKRTVHLLQQKFISYLLPTILMTMALSIGSIVDSLIVANFLDRTAFSSVGLCQPIILCFNSVFNFFGVGGATLAAIAKGRKEDQKANTIFSSVLVILAIFSAFFMVFGTVFLGPISNLLCQGDATVVSYIREYAIALILGCPIIIMVAGVIFFVRTDGQPKLASRIIILSNIINLVFDFLLIAVFKTGIIGASVSTVLGYFLGGLLLIGYFRSEERTFRLIRPAKKLIAMAKNTAASGVSSGMNTGLMFLKNLSVNLTIMSVVVLGEMGVAAFNVCNQTMTLAALFVGGTIQTILPIIGVLYGEEDKNGIRMIMKTAFKFAFTAAIVLFVLIEIFAEVIAGIFNLSGDAFHVAVNAIRIYCLILPFYAFNFIMINFYQTTQKRLLSALLSILQGFVLVVPAILFLSRIGDGTNLWFAFLIGEALTFACIWAFSALYANKHNLKGLLLEKKCECTDSLEITVKNNLQDVVEVSSQIMDFCDRNNIDSTKSQCVALSAEEMAANIVKYGYREDKDNYIDMNVKLIENEVVLRIRDNGVFFNPTVFHVEEGEFSGIETVKKLAKSLDYSRVLGFNTTIIKI